MRRRSSGRMARITRMSESVSPAYVIRYEHPLNERIRTLMRLEDLYRARAATSPRRIAAPDHHAALLALFEITDVAARADLKTDLLQELERQKQLLAPLRSNPRSRRACSSRCWPTSTRASAALLAQTGKVGAAPARQRVADDDQAAHGDSRRRLRVRSAGLPLLAATPTRARGRTTSRLDRAVPADPRRARDHPAPAARQRPREPADRLPRRVPADADDHEGRAAPAAHGRERPAVRAGDQRQQVRAQHPLHRRVRDGPRQRSTTATSSSS